MAFHSNGVPIQPLEVTIEAVESSIALVFSLLLPQAVLLFNYDSKQNNSPEEKSIADTKMSNKELVNEIEKFIFDLKCVFFYKSSITDRHFRRHRTVVDNVLSDLVKRRLLCEGYDETSFFNIKRSGKIKTYLKFIPTAHDQERFCNDLLQYFNMEYENYKAILKQSVLLPPNCELLDHGRNFICQPHYRMIITERKIILHIVQPLELILSNHVPFIDVISSNEYDDRDESLSQQPPVIFSGIILLFKFV